MDNKLSFTGLCINFLEGLCIYARVKIGCSVSELGMSAICCDNLTPFFNAKIFVA